jgi:hypothetical protein
MEVRMSQSNAHVAWYVWPFWALWRLVAWIVVLVGRLVAVVLGGVLMLAGFLLSRRSSAPLSASRSPSWGSCLP